VTDAPEPRARQGWVSLYAAALVLMVAGGAVLVIASLGSLKSIPLLWTSATFSAAAVLVALASVLAPRR
jgi:hypothetical protein